MRSSIIFTVLTAATALALPQPRHSRSRLSSSDSSDNTDSSSSTSDSSSGSGSYSNGSGMLDQATQQSILKAHNDRRACCGAPPMTWSDELGQIAAAYAAKCPTDHSHHPDIGENLYWTSASDGNGFCEAGLKAWTEDELPDYDGAFSEKAGHFSQVVWQESTEVGCGWQPDCSGRGNGMGTLVCNYKKAGNVAGDFQNNVGSCDFSKLGGAVSDLAQTATNAGSGSQRGSGGSDNSGSGSGGFGDFTNTIGGFSNFIQGGQKSRRSHLAFHKKH